MNWEEIKLSDVCEIGRGSSPRPIKNTIYFEGGDIPWVKIADATKSGKYIYETREHVNSYGASFSRLLPPNSLILAASGSLGQVNFLGIEGCIHDGWLYFKDFNGIDKDFLYYKLICLKDYFQSNSYGAAIQNINTDILRRTKINLPPIKIQRRIANILSNYDDLIENNLKRINLLEQAAQNIYKEWFVNMRFPGYESAEFDSETGLPEGWKNKLLGDILRKLESGKRPKGGINKDLLDGIPSIGAESVRGLGYFDFSKTKFITEEFYSKMNKGKLENKDILIYKDGAYIGRSTLFQDNFPFERCAINEHIFLIHTKEDYQQYYLYFTLHSDAYFEKMQNLNSNSAQPGINQQKLKSLKVLVPSQRILQEFDRIVTPLVTQIHSLSKMNFKLKQARDILLPRLMNQTIEV